MIFILKARNINTSIDYKVILEGTLTDYVITKDNKELWLIWVGED